MTAALSRTERDYRASIVAAWEESLREKLPVWPWARFANTTWRERCDRRIVDAFAAHRWTESLAVFAPTGAGKSSSAVAALWALAERMQRLDRRPPRVLYTTGPDLGRASRVHRLGQPEPELFSRARTSHVLILDEVHGSHTPTKLVFEVLDVRYAASRPTVVLTGHTPAEFGREFGAACLRRAIVGLRVDCFAKGGR